MKRKKKPGRKPKLSKKLRIPKLNHETELIKRGFKNIVGLDEVGRGALAGPVVAAACILPKSKRLYQIRDSKLLSGRERERLAKKIKKQSKWAVGISQVSEIEKMGIHRATLLAFRRALNKIKQFDFVLVDAYRLPEEKIQWQNIKRGDMVCASIAAASIIAKVYRDNLMKKLTKKYPEYFFEENKGYGTKKHIEALQKFGPSNIHRKNFRPVKGLL